VPDMNRREFIALLGGAAAWPLAARAQQVGMPVIGFLSGRAAGDSPHLLDSIRQGLKETGFIEGQNVAIEYRFAAYRSERLPALAADLVHRQVTSIVATGTSASVAAKAATTTIPIVFEMGGDPVELGLVPSLNRPGGNVTGVTNLNVEVARKATANPARADPHSEGAGVTGQSDKPSPWRTRHSRLTGSGPRPGAGTSCPESRKRT
jgi:putative tryptophan/tyrosine transport system substrate-binding protein